MATSLNVIANLLGAEGFSYHAAAEIRRYYRARVAGESGRRNFDKAKKAFGEVCKKLDTADRLVMGRYFGALLKAQFDRGLRLGLITHVTEAVAEEEGW